MRLLAFEVDETAGGETVRSYHLEAQRSTPGRTRRNLPVQLDVPAGLAVGEYAGMAPAGLRVFDVEAADWLGTDLTKAVERGLVRVHWYEAPETTAVAGEVVYLSRPGATAELLTGKGERT